MKITLLGLGVMIVMGIMGTTVPNAQADVLLQTDFEQDPLKAGWCAETPNDKGAGPEWADGTGHSGSHYLSTSRGRWRSPMVPVTPGAYYLVEAFVRGDGPALWHALYFDDRSVKLESSMDLSAAKSGICTGTDASVEWKRQVMCFRAAPGVTHAQLLFEPRMDKRLAVDDVTMRSATWQEAAQWAEEIAGTIPPITYSPPADRWQHLPHTRELLQSGGSLRMVLLGSSGINDVASGYPELLIRKRNPKAVIDPVVSVRGSTGCNYYQAPEQVKAYVFDHKPDVVLIECADFDSTVESIRRVVEQIRAASQAEIVLITNGGSVETWLTPIDPAGSDFFANVQRLASQEKIAFLDLSRPAARYFADCGKPYEFFRRDKYHFNDRGKQAMTQLVAAFFALPVVAVPAK